MSKTLKIYLLLFALLIAGIIAIDQTREKPLVWSPTYYLNGKKPLDMYVLNREIDHLFNDTVTRYDKTPFEYFRQQDSLNRKKESYLFIQNYSYFDEALTNKILNAVQQGSTLFVVSDGFPAYLTDTLRTSCCYTSYDTPVLFTPKTGNSSGEGVKLKFSKKAWSGEEYPYSPVFGQQVFVHADTTTATALGYMAFADGTKYVNFMAFTFGKGKIILHNQPVIFSNYSLLSNGLSQEYAERVLGYLPDQPIVWFAEGQLDNSNMQKSPLSVIFNYPALRMTWLIFLYGLLLFILFTAKRKQRVVPIIKPLRNTTVEFTQTIGNLYFQEGNIGDIARKKIIYFLDRVRRSYNIDTRLPEEKLILRLCLKSGKEEELVREIVSLIGKVNHQNRCNREDLIQLSRLMDRFWDNGANHPAPKK